MGSCGARLPIHRLRSRTDSAGHGIMENTQRRERLAGISAWAAAASRATPRFASVVGFLRANWRAQNAFLLVSSSVVIARLLLLPWSAQTMLQTLPLSLWPFAAAAALAICGYLIFKTFETRSLTESFSYLWSDVFTWRNATTAVPAFVMAGMFMNCFTFFKSNIPESRPYELDVFFSQIDRTLHLGIDPWRLTEYLLGYGSATEFLDEVYYLWFFAVYVSITICIGSPPKSALRHRFMLSYVLVWGVLGVVCATALSSVGPIYFDRIYGAPSAFSGLIQNLARVSAEAGLTTMQVRETLWLAYATDNSSTISGISAMPSIHNAMCVLLFLAARHIDRRLAAATAGFAILIFLGSVHLGWHYAIDAYVSLASVIVLWKLAGYLSKEGAQKNN
jgi:PAP2 superfamily